MADKLQAPLQFNRPSTKARPQDPRRFESHDVLSADAQQDPQYRRMVQDIEALQQRQGWLAGRGAFDKDDLLYLKHKQEEERLKEQEQRESESAAFAAAKARAALHEQEATKASVKQSLKQLSKQQTKTCLPVQPIVRVKTHSKDVIVVQHHQQEQHAGEPEAKRQKLAAATAAWSAERNDAGGQPVGGTKGTGTRTTDTPAEVAGGLQQQSGQGSQGAAAVVATAAAAQPLAAKQQGGSQQSAGLVGLLGGYGSDEDDEDPNAGDGPAARQEQQSQQQDKDAGCMQLPSAAELLEQDLPGSGFVEAHQMQLQALAEAAGESDNDHSSGLDGNGPTHHQQASWI